MTAQLARVERGAPVLVLESGDAGATLRFVDLYRRMHGGALSVQVTTGEGPQRGVVTIDGFTLRNEPALKRIASTQAQAAMPEDRATSMQIPRFDVSEVEFTRLRAEFGRTASRVEFRDGVVYGSQVGFKGAGWIDYGRDRTDISGTFVPAYGLNNAFAQVPLFGPILGGGKNEGLFAVNFRDLRACEPADADGQPAFGGRARVPAQAVRGRLRRDGRDRGDAPAAGPDRALKRVAQAARSRTWRFLPNDSLITPSGVRSLERSTARSSVTGRSLTRRPPPFTCRRASLVEGTSLAYSGPNAVSTPSPASSTARGTSHGRQTLGERALLEGLARRLGRRCGGFAAVQERRRLGRQHLLRLVDLGAVERFEPRDLVQAAAS